MNTLGRMHCDFLPENAHGRPTPEYDRSFGPPLGLEPSHKFGIRRDTRPLYEQSSLYYNSIVRMTEIGTRRARNYKPPRGAVEGGLRRGAL